VSNSPISLFNPVAIVPGNRNKYKLKGGFHSTLEGVAGLTAGEFGSTRVEVIGYKLAHSGYMEVFTKAA
jgi:hypothetical protein